MRSVNVTFRSIVVSIGNRTSKEDTVIVDRGAIGVAQRSPRTPQIANVTNRSHLTERIERLKIKLKEMESARTCRFSMFKKTFTMLDAN